MRTVSSDDMDTFLKADNLDGWITAVVGAGTTLVITLECRDAGGAKEGGSVPPRLVTGWRDDAQGRYMSFPVGKSTPICPKLNTSDLWADR